LLDAWSIAATGDDSVVFASTRAFDYAHVEASLASLGLDSKLVVHREPLISGNVVGYCSSEFMLIAPDTWFLSPKAGRVLAKLRWVKVTATTPQARVSQLLGNALGLWQSVQHTPFAREVVARTIDLCRGLGAAVVDADERATFGAVLCVDPARLPPLTDEQRAWVRDAYDVDDDAYDTWASAVMQVQWSGDVVDDVARRVSERDLGGD